MIILGIDPGHISGTALWDSTLPPKSAQVAEIHADEYLSWILSIGKGEHDWKPQIIVIENYILRPEQFQNFSSKWIELPEAKQIGAAHFAAALLGVKCIEQEPAIKAAGYGFAGMKYVPGKRGTHMQDALAHACYLAKKGYDPSKMKNPFAKPLATKKPAKATFQVRYPRN